MGVAQYTFLAHKTLSSVPSIPQKTDAKYSIHVIYRKFLKVKQNTCCLQVSPKIFNYQDAFVSFIAEFFFI